jgi:hypothetical protein
MRIAARAWLAACLIAGAAGSAIAGGGDGIEAVVDLDDLYFVPEPTGIGPVAVDALALFALRRGRGGQAESRRTRSTL